MTSGIKTCTGTATFVFQIDLTWSDGHKTASFRSYGEFFNLQCELLSQFPIEAGKQKNSQRTLPFLPGKQIFRRHNQQLAEERLPKIKNYVRELVMLPEHISQCERVLRFFQSNWKEDRIRCDQENMLPFQDQIEPINYCRSHTATEPILEEEIDRTLNVQIVATEPIPSGDVNQTSLEGYRQENSLSDGTKVEMTSFSHSDIVNQNVNHESVLDENLMSELTKESPPSYESVTKRSTTVIQAPTYTEKASSAIDNDTDMITVQPQSNVVNSAALDTDNTNSNCDISHSDIGIVYLRRRRYEIPDGDTVARWCIVICYIICIPCMILSAVPS